MNSPHFPSSILSCPFSYHQIILQESCQSLRDLTPHFPCLALSQAGLHKGTQTWEAYISDTMSIVQICKVGHPSYWSLLGITLNAVKA